MDRSDETSRTGKLFFLHLVKINITNEARVNATGNWFEKVTGDKWTTFDSEFMFKVM